MKHLEIFLIFLVCLGSLHPAMSLNLLPSDNITYHVPVHGINLQNVNRESAYAIDAQLPELKAGPLAVMPQIGHKNSEIVQVTQGLNDTVSQVQLNFTQESPKNLSSVGNTTGNFTVINGTIAWF